MELIKMNNGLGFLYIKAKTADDALPVSFAHVQIYEHNSNKLMYEDLTNLNGITSTFSIRAPYVNYAEVYGNISCNCGGDNSAISGTGRKNALLNPKFHNPMAFYSKVDVVVRAGGFITEHIKGVEIFDGQTAILPVDLKPIVDSPFAIRDIYTDIPENGLFLPDKGQVGTEEMHSPISPLILEQLIIPDYITVHLGVPTNTSAKNLRVKFTDYIKNVVSSEIFSTWPNNSIIANTHVIVTFALNRVYSEWYRARGYNFDITNSTQYDQYYRENGMVYANISQIVDEYFNTYIHRIGFSNPFFSSFCNGTTSTCAGLSQWGTVTLANQGYTPIQILRHYYGNTVTLSRSTNIQSITSSYPGYTLSQGSTGDAVRRIQNFLNRIRVSYPGIPQITNPNGVFGTDTANAVRVFQSAFSLSQTGTVNEATWNKISQIYVSITRLGELDAEGERYTIGDNPPTTTIQLGSRGNLVLEMEFLINLIAQYYSAIPTVIQDSVFEARERDAIIAFQRNFGLSVTGVVNAATWSMLYSVYRGIKNSYPTNPAVPGPPSTSYVEYTVVSGDSLWSIAQRFGTTVDVIMALNNLTSTNLTVGQILRVPSSSSGGNGGYIQYTVRPGDTLWAIAQQFGTTVDAIMALNNLTSTSLTVGQVLKIPTSGGSGGSQPTPPTYTEYTVVSGDSLWSIAQRFGTTVDAIMSLNGLTSTNLTIGQVLRIPSSGSSGGGGQPSQPGYTEYTVRSGDSLWSIAQRYGTTVDAIMSLNGLTSTNLSVGQVLRIPTTSVLGGNAKLVYEIIEYWE